LIEAKDLVKQKTTSVIGMWFLLSCDRLAYFTVSDVTPMARLSLG